MKYLSAYFIGSAWTILCMHALWGQSAWAYTFVSPLNKLECTAGVHLHRRIPSRLSPCYQQNGQSTEDFKISSQIARLNAVAAKLRAEAAELEAEQRKAMADNLAVAFREFDRNGDGNISVQELKDGLANILAKSINEEQALKIMSIFDKSGDGAIQLNEFQGVEEFRNKLDRILQDEKDAAFIAKREASTAKLAAEKAEAIAELINNRPPTRADRILAGLPYLFPLLDALPYGRAVIEQFHLQYNPIFAIFAFLFTVYQSVPFSGLIAFFTLNVLTNNLRLNRLVRFNIQQAILLDISLIFPGILGSVVAFAAKGLGVAVSIEVSNLASSALFLSFVGLFLYGVGTSWLGVEGDGIPFISERVKQRVPTTKEFLAMFDEEGNFRPPKPPSAGNKQAPSRESDNKGSKSKQHSQDGDNDDQGAKNRDKVTEARAKKNVGE